jgi:hypothetical protein
MSIREILGSQATEKRCDDNRRDETPDLRGYSRVYNSYTVRRTQVYLDDRQATKLRAAARATQRTVSAIIREAIDEKLERPDERKAFDSALAHASGIWADRTDLGSTDDYIRRIRRDRRGSAAR